MVIQKVAFTSSAFDKVRLNTQIKQESIEFNEKSVSESSADKAVTGIPDIPKNIVVTESKNHTARNWTGGLGSAAVLTVLGVLAGRHGYLGKSVEKVLKGAQKEGADLIDDITETAIESADNIVSETNGTFIRKNADILTEPESINAELSSESILNASEILKNPKPVEQISDEIIEVTPVSNSIVSPDNPVSAVGVVLSEKPVAKVSCDGKFKIPISEEELDINLVRKYLKMKKVKIPRKLKTLPEFDIKSVIGDFNPENVDKSKIVDGVYIHKLPKGDSLEVHYDEFTDNILYINRKNKKDNVIGYLSYYRNSEGGNLCFVEHPNGFNYRFNPDGTLDYGVYNSGKGTYVYDMLSNLKRIDENVGSSISRQTYIIDGKIRHSEYYVSVENEENIMKNILVKMDNYVNGKNTSENFYINGESDNYVYVKKKNTFDTLKFWQSEWFKNIAKKFEKIVLEEEEDY